MTTNVIEGYSLSAQQERVWLLQEQQTDGPYRATCRVRVTGPFERQVFTAALELVVKRHESLRTTFRRVPGMVFPVQAIGPEQAPRCAFHDMQGWSSDEQVLNVDRLWREAHRRPFDLAQGPVMHVAVARLDSEQHLIFLSVSALCADRKTIHNLVDELSRAYAVSAAGETLVGAPPQYADFSAWQNAIREPDTASASRMPWAGDIATDLRIKLPFEQPSDGRFVPRVLPVPVHPDIVGTIAAVVREYDTSKSVFFLACCAVLLGRHLGQTEVVIGTVSEGRSEAPLEEALGRFSTGVPIRCELPEHQTFRELLAQVHEAVRRAAAHAPVLRESRGSEAITTPRFFPFCFEETQYPRRPDRGGVSFELDRTDICTDRFKTKLVLTHQGQTPLLEMHYDASAFNAAAIASLVEQFQTLVSDASAHPETPLGRLELLGGAEWQRVVETFNRVQFSAASSDCLHHLFEAQVVCTPDHIAVVSGDACLTYAALNGRANQLARHLRVLGVGSATPVGICMPRSLDMIVTIFGILKAGGAYVPLDPTYPKDRLEFMIADVQAPVLLTHADLLAVVPAQQATAVCLDTEWDTIAQYSPDNLPGNVGPDHLAYAIYTSGSTGQPKGVLVTHRNAVQSTRARDTYYRERVESFLLLSSLSFDSSVAGLFWTMYQGGMLVLPAEGRQSDVGHLRGLMARYRVSHLLALPSLHALMLEQVGSPTTLRSVVVAGETCSRSLVAQHLACLPDVALFNEYGPTEGTVWCTVHRCQSGDGSTSVPIGRPIANAQVYVLDARLRPVPVGIAGELYVGGAGVSQGYMRRAALTAERFVPDPFGSGRGARLYKTGDLGRHRHDGVIEFLGRLDRQVKVRGFRIELGEVEATLQSHPQVVDAVVIARDDPRDRGTVAGCTVQNGATAKRLVAYVVATPGSSPSAGDLRRFMESTLPPYMIPTFFVLLATLPVGPNGKVDVKALPDEGDIPSAVSASYVAPATEMERAITLLWQQVLRLERLGIHDNFFDVGGHSLAMVQVHGRLQTMCKRTLSLIDLFQYPTVHTLAAYLTREANAVTTVPSSHRRQQTRRESTHRRQTRTGRSRRHDVHR